jgi:hypothetical protein
MRAPTQTMVKARGFIATEILQNSAQPFEALLHNCNVMEQITPSQPSKQ